ncbi:branched-chain amino acid ABC transporter permease [Paracoccus panacisoli]|uniref:Branched-chain amino acid ABC transporter permease n=1 Tax=Paracoccus panacisoli TaxID=1510163 RepID=A0ABV6T535_9RHOB
MLTILFDGLAYGMLLFVLAVGLSVTMGLMNVVNLAHGAFAMLGGYVTALLVGRAGVPFLATLPLAFVAAAVAGGVAERLVFRPLYRRPHLDQVLASIGLVYVAMAAASWLIGPQPQLIALPQWLQGRMMLGEVGIGRYRLFVIVVCLGLAALLHLGLVRSRFGHRLRAAVDDPRAARGLGIAPGPILAATFAVGSGLAGLGGALGLELMGVDPSYPLRLMALFLMVVAVGGTEGLAGPLMAALLIGVADTAGKYYLPALGGVTIYLVMIAALVLHPQGLAGRRA